LRVEDGSLRVVIAGEQISVPLAAIKALMNASKGM
jgi:hypothetical protein